MLSENSQKSLQRKPNEILIFAKALAEIFGPYAGPRRGTDKDHKEAQTPDPFEVFQAKGADEFRVWLHGLSVGDLRSIIRQHRFDPSRLSDKWKTKDRFIQIILDRVETRSKQGDVFRYYGQKTEE